MARKTSSCAISRSILWPVSRVARGEDPRAHGCSLELFDALKNEESKGSTRVRRLVPRDSATEDSTADSLATSGEL